MSINPGAAIPVTAGMRTIFYHSFIGRRKTLSEGNGSGKAPLSKGVIITRSSVWATYEVLLTLMPVLIWLFIIWFSKPEFEISLQFPAFSFFCVSIWAACIREIPRTLVGGDPVQDKFERECSLAIAILGFVISLLCLVFAALRSTGSIPYIWGAFSVIVATAGGLGILMLFVMISIKIQRVEYGRYNIRPTM
ncbi:hypothetical protein [Stutzerimonas zhaodongensis]|uniref:hypothetical protein n=1 Tax=Stutzerimonas TaxID=2901164 RepID=UPI00388D5D31